MKIILRYTAALTVVAGVMLGPLFSFAPTFIPNTGVEVVAVAGPTVATTTVAMSTLATTTAPVEQSVLVATTSTPVAKKVVGDAPFTVSIPAINLDNPVIRVGLNEKGEMDVPSGTSDNVGWYKHGPMPGEVGSAVLDAHVYAAFKNLDKLKVGDDIYVTNADGKELHFVVEETAVTKLEETSATRLFDRRDKVRLNLITCAGTYSAARGTYDHRLIVYAVLVT